MNWTKNRMVTDYAEMAQIQEVIDMVAPRVFSVPSEFHPIHFSLHRYETLCALVLSQEKTPDLIIAKLSWFLEQDPTTDSRTLPAKKYS